MLTSRLVRTPSVTAGAGICERQVQRSESNNQQSAMAQSWDSYLFQVHRTLSLEPWNTDIGLLDILIKVDQRGVLSPTTIISRVASMESAADVQVEGWPSVATRIKDARSVLAREATIKREDPELDLFLKDRQSNIKTSVSCANNFASRVFGEGFADARLELEGATSLLCTVSDVTYQKMAPDFLPNLLNSPSKWKPNIERLELQWPTSGSKDLYVVTEIKYAQRMVIGDSNRSRAQASAGISAAAAAAPAAPVSGAELKVVKNKRGDWTITAPHPGSPFPFAFTVTRIRYRHDGTLHGINPDMGKKRLVRRGQSKSESIPLDPSIDPEFHMQELLAREGDDILERIPLQLQQIREGSHSVAES